MSGSSLKLLTLSLFMILIFSFEAKSQCTRVPSAGGGFFPSQTCQPVTVTLLELSSAVPGNVRAGDVYTIDWGDGTIVTHTTTVNNEAPPAGIMTHVYGPTATNCSYATIFRVENPCGVGDQITGIVNVHDTDEVGMSITQDYVICEGYGGTFTFTDATTMNCLAPAFGDANDGPRTIRWEYGTGASSLANVTVSGNDASSSPYLGATSSVTGPGSNSETVVIPAASTVGMAGSYFEVTLHNWNDCNPFSSGTTGSVTVTARITVMASPVAPTAPDQDYCFGGVGPLFATGAGGTLRWYENATLDAQGLIASGTQVATGGTFAHGQTAPGSYTYWVTETAANSCEGPAREVTLNIREDLNLTGPISGDQNICPGETGITYSLPSPPATQTVGGTTEYVWSVPVGWTITAGQGTQTITVDAPSTTGTDNITAYWQYTSAPNCASNTLTLPVTINIMPAGNISGTQTICEGSAPTITLNMTSGVGNTGPFEVDYTDGTNNFTATVPFGSSTVTPSIDPPVGTTTYTITEIRDLNPNGCTTTAPNALITGSAVVTVREDLNLTDVVSGPTNVCPGDIVNFSLPVDPPTMPVGGTTVYQWRLPNSSGTNLGTITAGQNTKEITVQVGNNTGLKTVQVRWRYSNSPRCSTPWQTYNVTVNIEPEVEISGDQTICLGDNPVLTFSNLVGVGGSGPFDIDYTPDGGTTIFTATNVNIAGGTVNAPAPASAGVYTYTITEIRDNATNGCVSTAPSSNITGSATVTVRETLNLVDVITGPANVCANQIGAIFTLPNPPASQPVGGTTEYQWTVPADWTITSGQGTETLTVDIGSSTGPGRTVSVVWQYPTAPNCTSGSVSTNVTVDQGPTIATVGAGQSFCTTTDLVSNGLGGNTPTVGTGQWTQVSGPAVATITNNLDPNTTVSIANATEAGVYVFRWSISNGTCPPSTADITIDFGTAPVAADAHTGSGTNTDETCGTVFTLQGNTPLNVLGGAANGQWTQLSGPGITTFGDATDPNSTATVSAFGTYQYQWAITSGTCPSTTSTVDITFHESAIVNVPADFDVCRNSLTLVPVTASGTVSGSVSTGTWSVVGGTGLGTGTLVSTDMGGGNIDLSYTPVVGDLGQVIIFGLTSANPGTSCTAVVEQLSITIKKEPNVTNATLTQTICSGGTATFTPTSDVGTATFSWTASVISGGTVTGFSTSGTGNISEILINGGNNIETVRYVVTATDDGCTSPSVNFDVTVNPTPTVQADKNSETICNNGTTSIDLDAVIPVVGTTYTWTVVDNPDVTGESGDATGTLTEITQTLTNTSNIAQTVTYTVTPTANACSGPTVDIIVTVQPEPTITNGGAITICSEDQLNFTPTGPVSGTNFTWTSSSDPNITGNSASGSGTITDILTNSGTDPHTITYTITPIANGCTGPTDTYVVTVNPKPDITNMPVGAQSICSGDTYTFNPTTNITTGVTTYSWTVVSTGNITGLPGTGSGTGNISHTLTNTGTNVEIVTYAITPTANGCDGDLEIITVLVNPVADVSNAVLAETICDGDILNFVPTSNVVGTTFSWTAALTSGTVTGFTAAGTGSITDQLFNTTNAAGVVTYTITPTVNGCTGTPANYVVTVNPSPEVTNATLTATICSGDIVNFVPTSDVAGSSFNWSAAISGNLVGWTPTGSGNISQTITNTGTTNETLTYTITASKDGCSGTPVNFVVTVRPEPNISNPITDLTQTICSGGTATFTPIETVVGTTFNWTVAVTNGTATSADITAGSGTGAISSVITNTGTIDAEVTYTFSPVANTCPGPNFTVVFTITPTPDVNNLPATTTICSGESLNFTPTSSVAGTTFSWVSSVNANVTGNAANGFGPITDALTNTSFVQQTITYTVTPEVNGCPGPAQVYTVNIDPKPDVSNAPLTQTICSGDPLNIVLTSNVVGTTFSWTSSISGNITGNTAAGSGNITDNLVNTGTNIETVTYTIIPSASGCNGDPVNYVVTVNPTPNVNNPAPDLTQTLCSGGTATFNPTGDVAGTTYNWTATVNANIAGYGVVQNGTGAISEVLTNTGFNIETITYTITPVANGCNGPTVDFVVTINPEPNINNSPGNQTICSNQSFSYTPAGDVAGTVFNWTSSSSSVNIVGNTTNGSGAINDALTNNGVTSETVTYQITPVANGCNGPTETIVVTVNPRPIVVPSVFSQAICDGQATNITLTGDVSFGTGTTFSWTIESPGPNITGATAGTGSTIAQTLNNTGSAIETVTYRVTPSANGCDGNFRDIIVTVYPTPSTSAITSATGGSTDACVNGTNIYRVDGITGTIGSTYTWSIAPLDGNEPTVTAFNNNVILDFGPNPWTGTLSVVETTNGCDGPTQNLAVSSFALPVPDAGTDVTVCQGQSTVIGGTPSASGGSGTYSYQWTPATGLNNPFIANPTTTPTSTITYTLEVTDVTTGCIASDIITVTVEPLPPLPTISVAAGTPTFCEGTGTVTLRSSNVGAATYQWYKEDGFGIPQIIVGATNQDLVLSTEAESGIYHVEVISAFGCVSPMSIGQSVTINPVPAQPTISIVAGDADAQFCDDAITTVTLEAIHPVTPTIVSYVWYKDGNPVVGANTNQITLSNASESGNYTVKLIGIAPTSCESIESAPQAVVINPIPSQPFITITTGAPDLCEGDNLTLESSNIGAATYQWYKDGIILPAETNQTLVITGIVAADAGDYTVEVIGPAPTNCVSTLSPAQTINVNPIPTKAVISIAAGDADAIFCDDGATFVTLEANATDADSYKWFRDGVEIIGATGNQLLLTSYTETGNYTAQAIGIANSLCAGTLSDPFAVTIHQSPDIPVFSGPGQSCSGATAFLQITLTQGTAPYTIIYQDDQGNPPVTLNNYNSGDFIPVTPINNTAFPIVVRYTITSVTDANGCTSPSFGLPYDLQVKPLPQVSPIVGLTEVCVNDTNVRYEVTPHAGSTYNWLVDLAFYTAGGTIANGGGINDPFIELNLGATNTTFNVSVYETRLGCDGPTEMLTVSSYNPAIADAGTDQAICFGASTVIGGAPTATSGSGDYSYLWTPTTGLNDPFIANPTASPLATTDYTVTVTDNRSGCTAATDVVRVTVHDLPVITFNPIPGICVTATNYTLTEASPVGGIYSIASGGTPPGSITVSGSDYIFHPNVAGVGFHTIRYDYTDGNGCSNFATQTIEVYATPTVTLDPFSDVCIDNPPILLTGGMANGFPVTGGVYSVQAPTNPAAVTFDGLNYHFDPSVAGAGTHTIEFNYTDGNGCSNVVPATSTIVVNPLPNVSVVAFPNVGICNTPYTLTEGRVDGNPVVGGTYSGTGVIETAPGIFEFHIATAGVGTHTITFEYTDPATGCTNQSTADITVDDLPNIQLAPLANVGMCTAPFALTGGTPATPGTGTYSGPGVSEVTPGTFIFDPDVAGVGIHLIVYNYIDEHGCTNVPATQTITVEPPPFIAFGPINPICENAAPIVLDMSLPTGGVYSMDDPALSAAITFNGSDYEFDPSIAGAGTHIINYSITDAFGCSATEQQTIDVNPLPSGSISASGAYCNGGPLQFDLTGIAPFNIVYEDDQGNTFTANNVGNIYVQNVDPPVNTVYTLVSVTDRYGCTQNNIPPSSATVTITPVASFTVDPPQQIVPNQTVTITNNTNPGNWEYTWDFGDGNSISGTSGNLNITHADGAVTTGTLENPVHTYATYGNYTIELTVTDGNCTSITSNLVVIQPLPPIVDFEWTPSVGCTPLEVSFTNLTQFADEDSYYWQFGENEGFSLAQNPVYVYNRPGVYTVTLTAYNALGIGVTETKEMIIEVHEMPVARFTVRPTQVFLPDNPVFFTNLSFGGDSYLWDFGDGNTSTEFEPIHIYEQAGVYDVTLTVTNANQCTDVITIREAVVALDGGQIKVPNVFTPNPNGPSGGNVSLGTVQNDVFIPLIDGATEFSMEVYSRWGELIFATQSQNVGWDGYYKGKIAPNGVYLYKIEATLRDGKKITRVGDVTLIR
ncbi:PKD domain-containing protein [Fulvivirgaceae bacterium BMA10]|uniref:PKD domain-containing protein n=1 Tax=Splendidivirga corallicola TaxID=3051826 RepID=A0ABT8KRA0_9BACT|nr:PKD domain-containing protein [Fulvivirgaceae bacterium BMA10]